MGLKTFLIHELKFISRIEQKNSFFSFVNLAIKSVKRFYHFSHQVEAEKKLNGIKMLLLNLGEKHILPRIFHIFYSSLFLSSPNFMLKLKINEKFIF